MELGPSLQQGLTSRLRLALQELLAQAKVFFLHEEKSTSRSEIPLIQPNIKIVV
jgi:hypothetical protein